MFRGIWQTGEMNWQEPHEVHQRKTQSPSPEEEELQTPVRAGADLLVGSFAEKDRDLFVENQLNISQQRALVTKKANGILSLSARALPASQGKRLWLSIGETMWSAVSSQEIPVQ